MAEEKSLIKGLIAAMKAAGFATRDDVRGIVGEEITSRGLATKDDVQQIVGDEISSRGLATKDDVQKAEARLDTRLRGMDAKLTNVEKNMATKTQLKGLETKMGKMERSLNRRIGAERNKILEQIRKLQTTTPTINQFRELEERVDRYHPSTN